jgi:hypothetical protein
MYSHLQWCESLLCLFLCPIGLRGLFLLAYTICVGMQDCAFNIIYIRVYIACAVELCWNCQVSGVFLGYLFISQAAYTMYATSYDFNSSCLLPCRPVHQEKTHDLNPDAWFIFNLYRESSFYRAHTMRNITISRVYIIYKKKCTLTWKGGPLLMVAKPHPPWSLA